VTKWSHVNPSRCRTEGAALRLLLEAVPALGGGSALRLLLEAVPGVMEGRRKGPKWLSSSARPPESA